MFDKPIGGKHGVELAANNCHGLEKWVGDPVEVLGAVEGKPWRTWWYDESMLDFGSAHWR